MTDQWDSEKIYDDEGNFVFVGDLSPADRLRVTRSSFGTFLVSTDAANEADRLETLPDYTRFTYLACDDPSCSGCDDEFADFAECIDCGRHGCKGQCQ